MKFKLVIALLTIQYSCRICNKRLLATDIKGLGDPGDYSALTRAGGEHSAFGNVNKLYAPLSSINGSTSGSRVHKKQSMIKDLSTTWAKEHVGVILKVVRAQLFNQGGYGDDESMVTTNMHRKRLFDKMDGGYGIGQSLGGFSAFGKIGTRMNTQSDETDSFRSKSPQDMMIGGGIKPQGKINPQKSFMLESNNGGYDSNADKLGEMNGSSHQTMKPSPAHQNDFGMGMIKPSSYSKPLMIYSTRNQLINSDAMEQSQDLEGVIKPIWGEQDKRKELIQPSSSFGLETSDSLGKDFENNQKLSFNPLNQFSNIMGLQTDSIGLGFNGFSPSNDRNTYGGEASNVQETSAKVQNLLAGYGMAPALYSCGEYTNNLHNKRQQNSSEKELFTLMEAADLTLQDHFQKYYAESALVGWSDFLDAAIRIADILLTLESQGYSHCDVKLDNLVVTYKDGKTIIKLIDFDLVSNTGACDNGNLIHTPPELHLSILYELDGGNTLYKSDVHSLGSMLIELMNPGVSHIFKERQNMENILKGLQRELSEELMVKKFESKSETDRLRLTSELRSKKKLESVSNRWKNFYAGLFHSQKVGVRKNAAVKVENVEGVTSEAEIPEYQLDFVEDNILVKKEEQLTAITADLLMRMVKFFPSDRPTMKDVKANFECLKAFASDTAAGTQDLSPSIAVQQFKEYCNTRLKA